MNDVIKIRKSLEDLGVLIAGVTETVRDEVEKEEGGILGASLAPLAASVVQLVISSVAKSFTGKWVRRAGGGYNNMVKNV